MDAEDVAAAVCSSSIATSSAITPDQLDDTPTHPNHLPRFVHPFHNPVNKNDKKRMGLVG